MSGPSVHQTSRANARRIPNVGETHSNDLAPRFEESRRVVLIENQNLEFEIVSGPRAGCRGKCLVETFIRWSRVRR